MLIYRESVSLSSEEIDAFLSEKTFVLKDNNDDVQEKEIPPYLIDKSTKD